MIASEGLRLSGNIITGTEGQTRSSTKQRRSRSVAVIAWSRAAVQRQVKAEH